MSYLFRKLVRDIYHHWTQFFSVCLMAFLSTLIFVGLEGAWSGLSTSIDTYINEQSLADAWVQVTQVSEGDLAHLTDFAAVDKAHAFTQVTLINQFDHPVLIETLDPDSLTQPRIINGQAFDTTSQGIWLNSEYIQAHQLAIGDTITVTQRGQTFDLKLLGEVQSPKQLYFTGR